jgi:hypothetical protein
MDFNVILADRDLWRRNRAGLLASVLLHGAAVLLWLGWHLGHPLIAQPPLQAMSVDLVTAPIITPGPAGGAMMPVRGPARSAPRILGVTPKATAPPPDELEARIRGLASLSAPQTALPAPDNDGAAAGSGSGGGYPLADFVRAQILRRWWPDLGAEAARGLPVAMKLTMTRGGVISNICILDQQRFNNDKVFRGMALSARNAAINASPIALPPGHYDAVMEIAITLDPKAVLR